MDQFEFFQFKRLGPLTRECQIALLVLLYVGTIAGYWLQVQRTGKMDGYSPGVSLLFVGFYEEFIFRGLTLSFFERHYGKWIAIGATSFLFGLWHLKNIFWLDANSLTKQIIYTALIFSPILSWVTLRTRTLWPAVLMHLINNFPLG